MKGRMTKLQMDYMYDFANLVFDVYHCCRIQTVFYQNNENYNLPIVLVVVCFHYLLPKHLVHIPRQNL